MGPQGIEAMQKRATTVTSGFDGQAQVANAVASSAVSKKCAAENPGAVAFIRHLVLNTKPQAYAKACIAITTSPKIEGKNMKCDFAIIGGQEDYLSGPEVVKAWAGEIPRGRGEAIVIKDVGHWGAVEAPHEIGAALKKAISRS
jgi:pimeloyl-ACP methyl ester carboxylesterase